MTTTAPRPAIGSETVQDRLDIIELTSKLCVLADARGWDQLPQLFTDDVEVDYTSLNGGDPGGVRADELVAGWRSALDHLDATQHLVAGHVVNVFGDEATCVANVQATHRLHNDTGDGLWTVGGRYDFRLRRTPGAWRISAMTLTVKWATGNRHIMQLAAEAGGG